MLPECWSGFSCVLPISRCLVPRMMGVGFGLLIAFLGLFPVPLPAFLSGPDGEWVKGLLWLIITATEQFIKMIILHFTILQ